MDLAQEIKKTGYVLVDDVGSEDPDKALEAAIASISEPIAYVGLPMVMDLKPKPGYQPASFAGTGHFDLHTDLSWHEKPPKYIGMFCVNMESAGGGIPLLSDGVAALADLSEEDAAYLRNETITFQPPSHIDYPALTEPIITEKDGETKVRVRFDMLNDPPQPILNYLEAVNNHIVHIGVKPGALFIFDNERMLHGRTELSAGMTSDRFFKRIYGDI
ncbi:MAG: TauD/TfdA family dioxygenase [Chloroflexota bacterium]